jgi:hypothetical protein
MEDAKQYADRDIMKLDEDGRYYFLHVDAMTCEGLHGKSDIAAELGWRDYQIDQLRQKLEATQKSLNDYIERVAIQERIILNHEAKMNEWREQKPYYHLNDGVGFIPLYKNPVPAMPADGIFEADTVFSHMPLIPDGDRHLQLAQSKNWVCVPVYRDPMPAQNPLVDAVFKASYKKAVDTFGKCPRCSHECAQAAAIPEKMEYSDDDDGDFSHAYVNGWNDCINATAAPKPEGK